MNNRSRIKTMLWSLAIVFVLIFAYFFIPFPSPVKRASFLFLAALGLAFLGLGIALTIIARKEKGRLKTFLMLTGISATAPLVFSILHNVFYALAIAFEPLAFLFEFLHGASFIISLLIAPITFIIGITGSIVLYARKKERN